MTTLSFSYTANPWAITLSVYLPGGQSFEFVQALPVGLSGDG